MNNKVTRPTMDDVADKAGVSQMTVSRVMNGKGYISKEVRDRVKSAADEIGYVQNRLDAPDCGRLTNPGELCVQ
jgi:DNA-binding LacI/PurR family transcriptional regulator